MFYKGHNDLLLLEIALENVQADIRWEAPDDPGAQENGGDGDLFPHIYGPLNLDAVVGVDEFTPDNDGVFRLP